MIEEIIIKDLGVIKDATLSFSKGLNVLTGETGAGKTMVLTALGLLLGKRSDTNIIRNGASSTSVEGCWQIPKGNNAYNIIEEAGGEIEDGQLYINRTVNIEGKSKASAGGKGNPASVLSQLGDNLVSIHGQSDQMRLKTASAQRLALDGFDSRIKEALSVYVEKYVNWKNLTAEIEDIKTNMVARQKEFDDLTIALNDINKVEPLEGEDEKLKLQIDRLSNLEILREASLLALNKLATDDYDSSDALSLISEAVKTLDEVSEFDEQILDIYNMVEELRIQTGEAVSLLSSYTENIDMDAITELNEVQERRAQINSLIRKYGPTLDDVLKLYSEGSLRIEKLNPENSNIEHLEQQLATGFEKMKAAAEKLHKLRTNAAVTLSERVNKELEGLAMSGAKLIVNVDKNETYTQYGFDEVSFMLQAHGGLPVPVSKGSSGGEKSRIYLALELVLADPESTPTFIFDEVDAGVGGATAIEIGKRLAELSKHSQVIVVTHLPQVAAFADNHLKVLKTVDDAVTSTDVTVLDKTARVQELARMLSGLDESESGQEHAKELISFAENFKASV